MPVQLLNKADRDEVYRRTLAAVSREIGGPDDTSLLIGRCLDFSWHGYRTLKSWPGAPRPLIQAGSAQWPRVEHDDGISPTHFAYEWDPHSGLVRLVRTGVVPVLQRADGHVAPSLPEVHVWLGCPDTGELIDFTTGLWPLACQATLGLDWPGPLPPEYLWTFGSKRPAGVNYVPDREAIDCVIALLRLQGRTYP